MTLLSYPDPAERMGVSGFSRADDCVLPGEVIAERYRLDRLLMRSGPAMTWLATDANLGRPVLVHVVTAGASGINELLTAAQSAGSTTDAVFLRVLDADRVRGERYGAYVLCEYAAGASLEVVLRDGPLAAAEASAIARDIAGGLVSLHRHGQGHGHLSPRTVLLTSSGSAKVVGFLLEDALGGPVLGTAPGTAPGRGGGRDDVAAVGRLLYAMLLARWPAADAYGMASGPVDDYGRLFAPHQVDPTIPEPLSAVVQAVLTPGLGELPPIRTASELSDALASASGVVDTLDGRLTLPGLTTDAVRRFGGTQEPLPMPTPPPNVAHAARPAPVAPSLRTLPPALWSPQSPTISLPDAPGPAARPPSTPAEPHAVPEPPRSADALRAHRRRFWTPHRTLVAAFVLVALVLGAVIIRAVVGPGHQAVASVGVRDFDPKADGGDDAENTAMAKLAIDGQASTSWRTERYGKSASFNGRKPGVGLVLDLGAVKSVSSVKVTLAGASNVEFRTPSGSDASMRSQADWTPQAASKAASGEVVLAPAKPVSTRYVLVYLTALPDLGGGQGFQGEIAEIVVMS